MVLDAIAAFFGCLYAGVIAIPAPAPEASRLKRTLPRLNAIAADAKASLILTTASLFTQLKFKATLPLLPVLHSQTKAYKVQLDGIKYLVLSLGVICVCERPFSRCCKSSPDKRTVGHNSRPFGFKYGKVDFQIDLGAEKLLAADNCLRPR